MEAQPVNDGFSILGQQIPTALVLVYLQNYLKQAKWFPLVNYETDRLNHFLAIVLSGMATVGIHVAHSGTLSAGGTITFTFPALSVLALSCWQWLHQYILTKTAYVALQNQLKPAEPKP